MADSAPDDMLLTALAEQLLIACWSSFPLRRQVNLEWKRYRTTAGTAHFKTNTISLSSVVLQSPDQLRITLIHEYAHLLAFDRAGRLGMGHGEAWQQAMRDLGISPVVRHRYDCRRNQPRQVAVHRCDGCGKEIVKLRRYPRRARYAHVGCGGLIRFVAYRPIEG